MKPIWILGITGGVGCGKSTVLEMLETGYGACVIQADIVAHQLMQPGQKSYLAIVDTFGREILAEDGQIDRGRLGTLVFADEDKLQLLNSLTHPAVKEEIRRRIFIKTKEGQQKNTPVFIVIEAALLLEDHYDEICDEIWYIYADRETRFIRLAESRGYSRQKSQAMMDRQMGEDELRARCQAVIDNSGSREATAMALDACLRKRSPLFQV